MRRHGRRLVGGAHHVGAGIGADERAEAAASAIDAASMVARLSRGRRASMVPIDADRGFVRVRNGVAP